MKRRLRALPLLLLLAGCQHRHQPNPNATIEDEGALTSVIEMSDPRGAAQLLNGFHRLEGDAWRWSKKHFSVSLAPPPGAAERGARLELTATIPSAVARDLVGIAITPSFAGQRVPPFQLTSAGEQTARFDVPASLLQDKAVNVAFDLDRTVPLRGGETRELGLIVSRIALVTP